MDTIGYVMVVYSGKVLPREKKQAYTSIAIGVGAENAMDILLVKYSSLIQIPHLKYLNILVSNENFKL